MADKFDKFKTCKDCPDREVGCHSKCEGYLDRRNNIDEINKLRRKYQLSNLIDNDRIDKLKKRTQFFKKHKM